jgi:ribokinase
MSGVVVVGSMGIDLTAFADRLPAPGETVLGNEFVMVAGGKGLNQALAAARMGAPAWMVGCVGDDIFADTVLGALTESGADTSHVRRETGVPTGVAHIRVGNDGGNDIVVVPLANRRLRTSDVDAALDALSGRASVLLVQFEIAVDVAVHALTAARDRGMTTVLDPAPAPSERPDESVYRLVDVVTPNETEATLLTGVTVTDEASARQAAEALVQLGCGAAIVTLGAAGSVVARKGETTRAIPAMPVKAIDTTAAGDAYTGALGSRLAAGDDLDEAIRWATAAGALTTTIAGASSAIPTTEAVTRFLSR